MYKIIKISLVTSLLATTLVMANEMDYEKKDDVVHRHHVHENMTTKTPIDYRDGITVNAAITADVLSNVSGGVKNDNTILGNLDLTLELDTQKAGLWDNGKFFIYLLGNTNTNEGMTNYAGDLQTSSNIEAIEAFRVYEFWYEHFFAENFAFLVGLHDYNSEFDALEYGSLFTSSSFGIAPDISQVGPSIFPVTSLAARVAYQPTENTYILAAIYDGVSGDPKNPKSTAIKFNSGDGIFTGVEAGLTDGEAHEADYYKLALGTWYHSAEVENFAGVVDDKNYGIYALGEKTLFTNGTQALGAFFQLGFADSSRNQIGTYIGAGLNYKGLLSSRSDDLLGLAVAHAIASDDYKDYEKTQGNIVDSAETAIELTYEAELLPWLVVQPDVQYIINPSMDKSIDDALVVGVRITLVY